MYHTPQNHHNHQLPLAQHPSVNNQPISQNQSWHQPAYSQPSSHSTNLQPFPNAPPLLPPKPALGVISTSGYSPWNDHQVASPVVMAPSPPRPPPPSSNGARENVGVGVNHRSNSLPTMSAVPRIGPMIPPEHVRMLDAGKSYGPEASILPSSPQFQLLPTTYPNPHGHDLSSLSYALNSPMSPMPGLSPQMSATSPQMSTLSHTSGSVASSPNGGSLSASHSQLPFTPPPPPPPILARTAPTPAPPGQSLPQIVQPQPVPPPLVPHYRSDPQLQTMQAQSPTHSRQLSLPVFHVAPSPSPNLVPPTAPTPAPSTPTPAPTFPVPFAALPGSVRPDGKSWVGGLAPRPSMHFRPSFQPNWNHMPPIPQGGPVTQPPPASSPAPPLPPPPPHSAPLVPPTVPAIHIPTVEPMWVPPPPPPRVPPPPPRHAVTSPTVLTHGQWSASAGRPPLPPKEPPLLPKELVSSPNELPVPPKVPVTPPREPQTLDTADISPTFAASPLDSTTPEEDQDADLREALQRSMNESVAPRNETEDEDEEFQKVLIESMRETRIDSPIFNVGTELDTPPDSGLNMGSGVWTPVRQSPTPLGTEPAHASKPPPPLPNQEIESSTPEQAPRSDSPPAIASVLDSAIDFPSMATVASLLPSPTGPTSPDADEPPPPTYEEVTGSADRSPAMNDESVQPPVPTEQIARSSSSSPLLGVVSRSPPVQAGNNLRETRSPPHVVEAPLIEVVPPSHHNNLSRHERHSPAPQHPESSNEIPSVVAAASPPARSETITRSTSALPLASPRPRAASQAHPVLNPLRQQEQEQLGSTRQRVQSVSHASSNSTSLRSRASFLFASMTSSNSSSSEGPPHRTWAIDEEPAESSSALLLQPPQRPGALSRLTPRNSSKTNLQEGQVETSVETLLHGVSYGFQGPDPPTSVPMSPASPLPPSIAIDENSTFHVQAPNFRQLLRLLSYYGSTSIMASPVAIAASKSGVHSLRVVLHFVRGVRERDPWQCRLFLELHTPDPKETPVTDTSLLWTDSCINAPSGPRGKLYVVPGPLPVLPLSFQGLSTFLVSRLEDACRAPSDSNPRRLERILIECYGSVGGTSCPAEEIGGKQKGSGNLSIGGLFYRVKDRFSSDRGGTMNDHTYDLISPFEIEEYQ